MPSIGQSGKPQSRRYTPDEKAAAVRMVLTLRAELGTKYGTVKRVAEQLGYGQETVRSWVRQAEIDAGDRPGETTAEQARVKEGVVVCELGVARSSDRMITAIAVMFRGPVQRLSRASDEHPHRDRTHAARM
jgi:transposase